MRAKKGRCGLRTTQRISVVFIGKPDQDLNKKKATRGPPFSLVQKTGGYSNPMKSMSVTLSVTLTEREPKRYDLDETLMM